MKSINDIIIEKFGEQVGDPIMLSPNALNAILKFIKGNEDRGICLAYKYDSYDECYNIVGCFYDQNNGKHPKTWPWKKICKKEGTYTFTT